jgi:hypothetical protein
MRFASFSEMYMEHKIFSRGWISEAATAGSIDI